MDRCCSAVEAAEGVEAVEAVEATCAAPADYSVFTADCLAAFGTYTAVEAAEGVWNLLLKKM